MQEELLPLFLLEAVLFPRTKLPLHIFEDRYREMIGEASRASSEFGVVLAAEKGVVNTGCTAVVDEVTHRYPDGRLDIVTIGVRRFEILRLDTEKSYLRGVVDYFNDEETEPAGEDLKRRAVQGYHALRRFLEQQPLPEPEWHDPQLSFQLAQSIPDVEFRQLLLATRSEVDRMRQLVEFLPGHIARQQHISHVQAVVPGNGRGPQPPDS